MTADQHPTPAIYLSVEAALLVGLSILTFVGGSGHLVVPRIVLQVILGGVAVIWLMSILSPHWPPRRQRVWQASPIDPPLVAGLGIIGLSTMFAIHARLSLETAELIFIYVLGFWFCHEQVRARWFADLLVKCLLIVTAVMFLFSAVDLASWYLGWPDGPPWPALGFGFRPPAIPRFGFALMRSNHLAAYVAPLASVVVACGVAATSQWRRAGWLAFGLLLIGIVAGTGSKGGTLGMLVGLGALAFGAWLARSAGSARFRVTRTRLVLVALMLAALSLLGMLTAAYVMGRGGAAALRSAASRFDIWVVALRMLADYPLLGVGPGDFGLAYLQYRDPIQLTTPHSHAHNMFLHTLATTGIAGGLAALWLVVTFLLAFWRLWRADVDRHQRWIRLGSLCGLVAFATHGLVDTLFVFPPVTLVVIVLAALALRPNAACQPLTLRPRCWWIKPAIVSAAVVAWLGAAVWIDVGMAAHDRAAAASRRGDWVEAVSALQQAAQVDPEFDYYRLQLGLAYGQLAAQDPTYLDDAVAAYRSAGIEADGYMPSRLNYGYLLWESGDPGGAIREMTEAARRMLGRLPQEHYAAGNYRLNLGSMLEAVRQTEAARLEYARAVALAPGLFSTSFWDAGRSGVRDRAAVASLAMDLLETSPEGLSGLQRAEFAYLLRKWDVARVWAEQATQQDPTQTDAWLCQGRIELAAGHPRQALDVADRLERVGGITSASLLLRTMANLELGNLDEASRHLRALRFAPVSYHACVPFSAIKDYSAHFLAARLAERQGDVAIAQRELQAAAEAAGAPQLSPYGRDVWGRNSLATETIPLVLSPVAMDAQAEAYLALGDLYARQGLDVEARQAFRAVLSISPDHFGAQQRLSALGE
jgi:O-antigen ligase/tetratricopeptide (TPR) repeat protein